MCDTQATCRATGFFGPGPAQHSPHAAYADHERMDNLFTLTLKLVVFALWIVVLPAVALVATPFILLKPTATGDKPTGQDIRQRYKRILFFWLEGLGPAAS